MNDDLDYTIEFMNKNFDLESQLPDEYNAGNQCYGRDVADYIAGKLKAHCTEVDFLDEDWGWQVFGKADSNKIFEINIYPWGFLNDAPGDEFYLWRLRLCVKQKRKSFGFITMMESVKCDEKFCKVLKRILSKDGFNFIRMEIGLEWR